MTRMPGATAFLLFLGVAAASVAAEQPDKDDPVFQDLLAVRKGLIEAYNAHDLDALLSYCHEDIIVTWQNAEVSRGREGIRTYYQRMMTGEKRVVDDLQADPTVDDRAILFGENTAVSRGLMNDRYKLRDGSDFALNSRWSATLVKTDGQWLIASFHASTNAFDNDILRMVAKKTTTLAASVALVAGLILGIGGYWLIAKRRRRPA
jgi:ketosteroid isomerase-like protein